jgi:hypothetical protein
MERHEDEQFYGDAKKHWETITPTVDGMLGGFAKISQSTVTMLKKTLKNNFIILLKDYINWYQVKPFLLSFVNVLISSTRSTNILTWII